MKQALQIAKDYMNDRLEDHDCKYQRHPATEAERINILADIETVKEALAKQEQRSDNEPLGEPVGTAGELFTNTALERLDFRPSTKIYTTPQQRKPLTDEQIYDMYNEPRSDAEMLEFAEVNDDDKK
ncbi:MAG TPA: hypothetical protein DCR24_05805 [Bacillus bacterium]|nr:hypothetical protein [Bacillus sp. (in: firmicutes)]